MKHPDRIFSGDYSRNMWKAINKAKTKSALRNALYLVCCRLQELESKIADVDYHENAICACCGNDLSANNTTDALIECRSVLSMVVGNCTLPDDLVKSCNYAIDVADGAIEDTGNTGGAFGICPICGWEDDPVQNENEYMHGGANKGCLFEHKMKFAEKELSGLCSH